MKLHVNFLILNKMGPLQALPSATCIQRSLVKPRPVSLSNRAGGIDMHSGMETEMNFGELKVGVWVCRRWTLDAAADLSLNRHSLYPIKPVISNQVFVEVTSMETLIR